MKGKSLKQIIKTIDLDDPGMDFTDGIMKTIASQEELGMSPAIVNAVRNEFLIEPSYDFTASVMENIQHAAVKNPAPIISRKAWIIIGGLVAAAMVIIILTSSGGQLQQGHSYLSQIVSGLSGTSGGIVEISGSVFPFLIPLSVLLLLDYAIRSSQGNRASV